VTPLKTQQKLTTNSEFSNHNLTVCQTVDLNSNYNNKQTYKLNKSIKDLKEEGRVGSDPATGGGGKCLRKKIK